jgi:hypothetical protein
MITRLLAFALFVLVPSTLFAESLRIEPKHARFDVATASSTVRQTYTVTNQGSKRIVLREWKTIGGLGDVKRLPASLEPGASATFDVELVLPGTLGESLHRFALFTDEADVERYRFTLGGFVHSLVSPAPALLDLGKPAPDSTAEHTLTLEAREATPLRLERVAASPDWLDTRVDATTVHARLRKGVGLGVHGGSIRVATNLAAQPYVDIAVKAIVEGRLRPSVYALGMRPVAVGSTAEAVIDLHYTGKAALSTLKSEVPEGWKATQTACPREATPAETGQCLRVTLSKRMAAPGRESHMLKFRLDGEPDLTVPFGTIVLAEGRPMREMVVSDDAASNDAAPSDIAQALRETVASPANPAPAQGDAGRKERISHAEGKGPVRLTWRAANDDRVFGYMVYRATDRAGPFHRVSDSPVRRNGASAAGEGRHDYTFTDASVKPGTTYYYYIDSIAKSGAQARFSPVMSKKVVGN